MNAVTLTEAKANLEQIIEQAITDVEPTIISTDMGPANCNYAARGI